MMTTIVMMTIRNDWTTTRTRLGKPGPGPGLPQCQQNDDRGRMVMVGQWDNNNNRGRMMHNLLLPL
jgi:hypothetical protein